MADLPGRFPTFKSGCCGGSRFFGDVFLRAHDTAVDPMNKVQMLYGVGGVGAVRHQGKLYPRAHTARSSSSADCWSPANTLSDSGHGQLPVGVLQRMLRVSQASSPGLV